MAKKRTNDRKPVRIEVEAQTPSGDPLALPLWLPPIVFALLTAFLFRDFIFSDQMLAGSDTQGMGYVVRQLFAEALRELGAIPGWAPHILGGTPFLEALSAGDSLYPPSLLLLMLMEPYRALGWKLVLHFFLAGLFMFGWIRTIGGSRPAALLAGVAYLMAPFFVSFVAPGHDGKIFVIALTPLLFWAVERHFLRPGLASVASIGLVVAFILYTTHFQMAYFLFGGVGLYAGFRAIQITRGSNQTGPPRPRAGASRFAIFLAAAVLGAGGAAYQFFPAADYVMKYSRRIQTTQEASGQSGREWSSSYSMNPEEVMSLIVPEFPGNGAGGSEWTNRTYWGRNGLKNNHEYVGLVVLLLAAVSFLGAARRGLRWFFVGLGLLSLGFALGANTPVWGLFYQFLPGIRLFRAPGMAVFLFGFGVITLAALGLDRILHLVRERNAEELQRIQRVLWVGTGLVALLTLLVSSGVFTSLWTSAVYPSIDARRLQVLQAHLPNIIRGASFALLVAAATSLVVWGLGKGRISPRIALAGLLMLVAVDAARIDGSFIQTIDFNRWAAVDPNLSALLAREEGRTEPYRLLSLAQQGQDVIPAMHGIELAAGHHPNDLSRYRELIGMVGSGLPRNLLNTNVRNLLNVDYILWPDIELGAAPQGPIVSRTQYGQGQIYHTLLADKGLPRARLVAEAVVKADAEAVSYILSGVHDPAREVVLSEPPAAPLGGGEAMGSVTWEERTSDVLRWHVESDRAAMLVVSDNWFPAWRATVNGEETEVLRAYHSLRAVAIPAGSSSVEMRYESTLLEQSFLLSAAILLLLFAAGLLGIWRERTGPTRREDQGATLGAPDPTGANP